MTTQLHKTTQKLHLFQLVDPFGRGQHTYILHDRKGQDSKNKTAYSNQAFHTFISLPKVSRKFRRTLIACAPSLANLSGATVTQTQSLEKTQSEGKDFSCLPHKGWRIPSTGIAGEGELRLHGLPASQTAFRCNFEDLAGWKILILVCCKANKQTCSEGDEGKWMAFL